LEEMLRVYASLELDGWDAKLAFAEFAINNSWQETVLILQWSTFLANGVNVTQFLAAARAGYSQRTHGYSPRTVECFVVTPTLKWNKKYRSVMSHY
jgi:hypothetical protein